MKTDANNRPVLRFNFNVLFVAFPVQTTFSKHIQLFLLQIGAYFD